MSILSITDLGTLSDAGGSMAYPAGLPPGSLIVIVGGQGRADSGTIVQTTFGDGFGNVFGESNSVGAGPPFISDAAAAILWVAGPIGNPNPAGAALSPAPVYLLGAGWWFHGFAVTGADRWSVLDLAGASKSSAFLTPLSVAPISVAANPSGCIHVQSGAALKNGSDPAGADYGKNLAIGPGPLHMGAYGDVSEIAAGVTGNQSYGLAVDDSYSWSALHAIFLPLWTQSGNVHSLAMSGGRRLGRAYQNLSAIGPLATQPTPGAKHAETLGDNAHSAAPPAGNWFGVSLGCRGSSRWDLFACNNTDSGATPNADVIHARSYNDMAGWQASETLLSGRWHSVSHVLAGGRLVLALWDDSAQAWSLVTGTSATGDGSWTMNSPVALVSSAFGQGSLRRDRSGRYWFAYVETSSGHLRLLTCDNLAPNGTGSWASVTVDDGAVGSGYMGCNLAIKPGGLLVFHLMKRVTAGGLATGNLSRVVASRTNPTDPDTWVWTAPVSRDSGGSPIAIQAVGDVLFRGDGSAYWGYVRPGIELHTITGLNAANGGTVT